jgi:23S rRNA (guanine745-N1)-methyltransferase
MLSVVPLVSAEPPPLSCTVRGCGLALARRARTLVCPRGHAYDIASSGYVNLLQPQDRRSPAAGDPPAVVAARVRLEQYVGAQAVTRRFVERAAALPLRSGAVVLDLGAGTGAGLALLASKRSINGVGIDLSAAAAECAARRFPALTWVVANADRRLPILDGSVDLVLSLHARRHPVECARVLTASGHLLVAVPAPDDLIELRATVQGEGVERDRTDQLTAEHASHFVEVDRLTVRERVILEGGALRDLLDMTYRRGRANRSRQAGTLESLEVTLASNLSLFRRKGT